MRRYDNIVVGAGSAGAVIAARMTESSANEVLLLEAGPDYADDAWPVDLRDGTHNSMRLHDWGHQHRPHHGPMSMPFPRGRVVGGSSSVNTCIALRGQPYDYDEWAERGLSEWTFEQCLPAFKRLEDDLDVSNAWHGNAGPIPIRRHRPEELVPWQAAFVEAALAMGFPACDDTNDPRTTGVGPHAMNKIEGVRMNAARCYLDAKTRARPNLHVRADTLVRRVLVRGRRAYGVEVETRGQVEVIEAKRVVLSAGAIATPGILFRSGIGPRARVEGIGVSCVADLPVGEKLLDHPGNAIFFVPKPGVARLTDPLIQTALRYGAAGSSLPNDVIMQAGSCLPLVDYGFPLVTIMASVGKPRGIGSLTYTSADPHAKPRILSRLLEDDRDARQASEAMELAWLLGTSKVMRDLATLLFPSERVLRDRTQRTEWVRSMCGSGYHPTTTAPMGTDGDPDAVVDGRGRVRGVDGLVIADASIMPTMTSANTHLTVLMIGERIGAWLRDGQV